MMEQLASRVRALPPWAMLGIVAVAALGVVMWYEYRSDDTQDSWLDVDQPPVAADFPSKPPTGPAHGAGRPLDVCGGFRSRAFPPVFDLNLGFGLIGRPDGC